MGELSKLPNISAVIEAKLMEAGISTQQELFDAGSKEAFMRIRLKDTTACLNMLCAIEGAIQGIRWHDLPDIVKSDLRSFHKGL
ncbi:MAG: TfoX/Sxy family protein [Christensenellaceae bacterium]|jgi:DNA transformation protein|nr:TfoX/Sxy family protein [Christensenellaceae bacterium]